MEGIPLDTDHTQELADQGLQQYRIERGAEVLGTDGVLGTLEQVVVDRDTGQPRSLVLHGTDGSNFELPYDLIAAADERGVEVSIGRTDLQRVARPYTPDLYVPVEEGMAVPPGQVAQMDTDEPVITHIESDAVEITTSLHDENHGGEPLTSASPSGIADQPTVILGPRIGSAPDLAASAPSEQTPAIDELPTVPVEASEMSAATTPLDTSESLGMATPLAPAALTPDVLPLDAATDTSVSAVPESDSVAPDIISPPVFTGEYLPEGDFVSRSGGLNVAGIVATGILLGTFAAGATYLLVRQRQRRASRAFGQVPGRLADLRDATASTLKSARATASRQVPAARPQLRQASNLAKNWLPTASAALEDLRDELVDRSAALGPMLADAWSDLSDRATEFGTLLRTQATRAGGTVSDTLPGRAATLSTIADGAQTLAASGKQLGKQLVDSAASMQNAARRQMASTSEMTAAKAAAAQAKAERQRQVAARKARRFGRRVRWFQRGLVAGALWAIFYAPEPGSELRAKIAGTASRIPGLDSLVGENAASTIRSWSTSTRGAHVGGTGPRPRDTSLAGDTLVGGPGTHTSLLEPTSEAPLQPPLTLDTAPDEVTGIAGL